MTSKRSLLVMPDEGPSLWMLGDHAVPKLASLSTGDTLALAVLTCPPGSGPVPHVHAREDEFFYVLDGQFDFLCNDLAYRGRAGDAVYSPRGTLHAFRNSGTGPSKLLLGVLPPGNFEQFVMALAMPAVEGEPIPLPTPESIERFSRLAPHYGITMVPDAAPPRQMLPVPRSDPAVWVLGDRVRMLRGGDETGGTLTATEVEVFPGRGPPLHTHRDEDETLHVLEGTIELSMDDRVVPVGPGTLAYLPAGTVHRYRNTGTRVARLLSLHTPGGFERFVAEAGLPAVAGDTPPRESLGLDPQRTIARRFGIDFPPPAAGRDA